MKTRLRVRAAEHRRSMEEKARIILREAVDGGKAGPGDLARFTRECFASLAARGGCAFMRTLVPSCCPITRDVAPTSSTGNFAQAAKPVGAGRPGAR